MIRLSDLILRSLKLILPMLKNALESAIRAAKPQFDKAQLNKAFHGHLQGTHQRGILFG